jgi:hypothetical protein
MTKDLRSTHFNSTQQHTTAHGTSSTREGDDRKKNKNKKDSISLHNLHSTMDTTEEKKNDKSVCHALPCKIEFTGKAPVYLYFQPHAVENDTSSSSSSSSSSGSSSSSFQAAQFRGRGLLACSSSSTTDSSSNSPTHPQEPVLHGRLLAVNSDKTGVSVQANFEHLTEWHHEHQPAAVQQATKLNKNPNRVQLARDWFSVAAALHAPVPVESTVA